MERVEENTFVRGGVENTLVRGGCAVATYATCRGEHIKFQIRHNGV
jgi:hypothetical protein